MAETSVELDNFNSTYYFGETITGKVRVASKEKYMDISEIELTFSGVFVIRNAATKPPTSQVIPFLSRTIRVCGSSRILYGDQNTFEFKTAAQNEPGELSTCEWYESYHGVLISVKYELSAEVITSKEKYSGKSKQVIINKPGQGIRGDFGTKKVPYSFKINQDKVEYLNVQKEQAPKFNFECHANNINCNIDGSFDGYIIIRTCTMPIKSIELQFNRIEQYGKDGPNALKEKSEIQNLQIGDGDVNKDLEIPLFMIFPKIFSCATLDLDNIKIKFEMNIQVVLVNGLVITDNFPVNTWRA